MSGFGQMHPGPGRFGFGLEFLIYFHKMGQAGIFPFGNLGLEAGQIHAFENPAPGLLVRRGKRPQGIADELVS